MLVTFSAQANEKNFKINDDVPKSLETIDSNNPDDVKFIQTHYKDLDEDGVPDAQDQCLNTGRGYKVNQYGCELDSDYDSVYDRFDQCPDTPVGTKVNFLGCEPDADKDMVLDSQDQCPDTPLGAPVDRNGCPSGGDSDGDGIMNAMDRCPNTPPEFIGLVNASGCKPESQPNLAAETNTPFSFESASDVQSYNRVQDYVVTNVIFDLGSYDIRSDQRPILDSDAAKLAKINGKKVLLVTGHTDDIGTTYRNLKLSWNRAQSVKDYLVNDVGIPSQKIYIIGKGESQPATNNLSNSDREMNRRIELDIIPREELPREAKAIIPDSMKGYDRWGFKQGD